MDAQRPDVTITADGYTARIGLRGGQLLSVTSDDPVTGDAKNMIVPQEQVSDPRSGTVLAPWASRVVKDSYPHGGSSYRLPAAEGDGPTVFGLLHAQEMSIQRQNPSEVTLQTILEPTEGYPFRLEFLLQYRVSGDLGLTSTLSVRYLLEPDGESSAQTDAETTAPTAPFAAGFHPYLTAADAPLKSCRLRLPAAKVAATSPAGKLLGVHPVDESTDLKEGPLLAGRHLEHTYTGLPDEAWTAELLHGPSGFMVRMISNTAWVKVYTGENIDRAGVAVGPMTCPPNGLRTGTDLVELEAVTSVSAGGWYRVGYSLEAFRL